MKTLHDMGRRRGSLPLSYGILLLASVASHAQIESMAAATVDRRVLFDDFTYLQPKAMSQHG